MTVVAVRATKVNHERVRRAMWLAMRDDAARQAAFIAARNAEIVRLGYHICSSLDRTKEPCTRIAVARFVVGWRCRSHATGPVVRDRCVFPIRCYCATCLAGRARDESRGIPSW